MSYNLPEALYTQRRSWRYGAMVARLTPDQKVGCSSHSGVINVFFLFMFRLFVQHHIVFSTQNRVTKYWCPTMKNFVLIFFLAKTRDSLILSFL